MRCKHGQEAGGGNYYCEIKEDYASWVNCCDCKIESNGETEKNNCYDCSNCILHYKSGLIFCEMKYKFIEVEDRETVAEGCESFTV